MEVRLRKCEIRLRVHGEGGTDVEEYCFLSSVREINEKLMSDSSSAVVGTDKVG